MASRGVNKVIVCGNLGADPELKKMPNGNSVCNISIATSESWKDQSGNPQERTEWHRITFYQKAAEIITQYSTKGSTLYVEGKLNTRKWQDQDGNDRYSTEIIGDKFQFMGGGQNQNQGGQNQNQNQGGQNQNQNQGGQNQNQNQGGQNQNQNQGGQNQNQGSQNIDQSEPNWNDDIPF